MTDQPFISICIPAYNRVNYLERLLDSIGSQTFTDFEVVITDDSPGDQVRRFIEQYQAGFPLHYFHNGQPLGTPENWNESIRRSQGQWIKIMHDDDWFASPDSLKRFYELCNMPGQAGFIFCGSETFEDGKIVFRQTISRFNEKLLEKDPRNLFYLNFIGPPSVVVHRNNRQVWYDKRMKWLVDIDFYIRFLQCSPGFHFTREYLVNVGFNEQQVTKMVFHNKEVVIPENLLLLQKTGTTILKRVWNYDFAWRLLRNYRIRDKEELYRLHLFKEEVKVPAPLLHILKAQKRIPPPLLRIGPVSKILMLFNYCTYHLFHRS